MSEEMLLRDYERHFQTLSRENRNLRSENTEWSIITEANNRRMKDLVSSEMEKDKLVSALQLKLKETLEQRDEAWRGRKNKQNECRQLFSLVRWNGVEQILKEEMALNNKWNSLRLKGRVEQLDDLEVILQSYKDNMKKISEENMSLRTNLLKCTSEYQEKIFRLNQINLRLQMSARQPKNTYPPLPQINSKEVDQRDRANYTIAKMKIEMKKNIEQYKQQFQILKQQSITTKNNGAILKGDAISKDEDTAPRSFNEYLQLSKENARLRSKLSELSHQFQFLSEKYPKILNELDVWIKLVAEIDSFAETRRELQHCKTELVRCKEDAAQREHFIKERCDENASLNGEISSRQIMHRAVMAKLNDCFQKMNPYFNVYSYSSIGFTDQELRYFQAKINQVPRSVQGTAQEKIHLKRQLALLETALRRSKEEQVSSKQQIKQLEKKCAKLQCFLRIKRENNVDQDRIERLEAAIEQLYQQRTELLQLLHQKQQELVVCHEKIRTKFEDIPIIHLQTEDQVNIPREQPIIPLLSIPTPPIRNDLDELFSGMQSMINEHKREKAQLEKQYSKKIMDLKMKIDNLMQMNRELIMEGDRLREKTEKEREEVKVVQMRSNNESVEMELGMNNLQSASYLQEGNQSIGESTIQNLQELLSKYEQQFKQLLSLYEKLQQKLLRVEQLLREKQPEGISEGQRHTEGHIEFNEKFNEQLRDQLSIANKAIASQRESHKRELKEAKQLMERAVKEKQNLQSELMEIRKKVCDGYTGGRNKALCTLFEILKRRDEEMEAQAVRKEEEAVMEERESYLETKEEQEIRKCVEMGLGEVLEQALALLEQ